MSASSAALVDSEYCICASASRMWLCPTCGKESRAFDENPWADEPRSDDDILAYVHSVADSLQQRVASNSAETITDECIATGDDVAADDKVTTEDGVVVSSEPTDIQTELLQEQGIQPITRVEADTSKRMHGGLAAIDEVTGGGVVEGGVHLLGGEPGVGKSTLLLQMASGFVQQGKVVLYVSAEESPQQVRERAARLDVLDDKLLITSHNEVEQVISALWGSVADVLIVDSVQRLYTQTLNAQPGTPSQVRFCTEHLVDKSSDAHTMVLVCQVTKDGRLAGPKTLEHLVDVVLHLSRDGDNQRTLASIKNRFGPSASAPLWMGANGLVDEPVADAAAGDVGSVGADDDDEAGQGDCGCDAPVVSAEAMVRSAPSLGEVIEAHLARPMCVVLEDQVLPTDNQPWALLQGDALQLLGCLPPDCVDGVITDPPYGSGTDLFAGDMKDQHSYLSWSAMWMSSALRACKEGSPICVFTQWRQVTSVVDALQAAGWVHRGIGVWDKTPSRTRPQKGRLRDQADFIVWGSKGAMSRDGPALDGVFRHAMPKRKDKGHPTIKPVELMKELVRLVPEGGRVLDPFCGSGATLQGALQQRRQALGIEFDADFAEAARDSLRLHCNP